MSNVRKLVYLGQRSQEGTVSAPTYSFITSSTTGIDSLSANVLNFVTNGVNRGSFDSSGLFDVQSLTASRALASNSSKQLVSSSTTDEELGYVAGVSSSIQTQLNGKQASLGYIPVNKAGDTMTGALIVSTTGDILSVGSSNAAAYNAININNPSNTGFATLRLSVGTGGSNSQANLSYAPGVFFQIGPTVTDTTTPLQLVTNSGTIGLSISPSSIVNAPKLTTTLFQLLGSSSGFVGFNAPAAPTSYSLTLPTAAPTVNGQVMTFSTAGVATFATAPSPVYTAPTVTKYTSGSGTYTKPANVLYLKVRMVGAGGGGFGANGSATAGGTGGNTTFGGTVLVANGGIGASGVLTGGAGGSASLGTGAIGSTFSGANGSGGGQNGAANVTMPGGTGGVSFFGGGGTGGANSTGGTAKANTGSGGGGAGGGPSFDSGAGGGAGGFVDAILASPLSSYAYVVGLAGAAGGGFTSAGAGASGYIEITEMYQ